MDPMETFETRNAYSKVIFGMNNASESIHTAFSYFDRGRAMIKESEVLFALTGSYAKNIAENRYSGSIPARDAFMRGAAFSMPLVRVVLGYDPKEYPSEDADFSMNEQSAEDLKNSSIIYDDFINHVVNVSEKAFLDTTEQLSDTINKFIEYFCNDNSDNETMFRTGFGFMIAFAQQGNVLRARREQKELEELWLL